jgi:subtilisin-like proprotein convertase family protein
MNLQNIPNITPTTTPSSPSVIDALLVSMAWEGLERGETNVNTWAALRHAIKQEVSLQAAELAEVIQWMSKQAARAFHNAAPIQIPEFGMAHPYPSSIIVADLPGTIAEITVTLKDIDHTSLADIALLLVGPEGQNAVLLANAGETSPTSHLTLALNQGASNLIPVPTVSGLFKPTVRPPFPAFFSPAPPPSGVVGFDIFHGTNPNGRWELFVIDQATQDRGHIHAGWELTLATCLGKTESD